MEANFSILGLKVVWPAALQIAIGPYVTKTILTTEGTGPVDIHLGDNQFTTIHLHGLDALNVEGHFTSPPQWTLQDDTIARMTPTADGLACRVEAASPVKLGTTTLTVTDADDATVPPLLFNITIGAEPITHLGATVDPPTEKPAAPPGP